ncbi:hypothetical protein D0863_15308 [Hortaea werneckii]|uniref:Uncharacterized protein n=1 Tax=Hortaea werneckii TaxID=91943 RepID=A0A3M7C9W3_HORWE|nr:hypothetical protein D0863_15308 [Hortaea werneckii]
MSTAEAGNTSQIPFYDASETGGSAPTASQNQSLLQESEQQASEAFPNSVNLPFPAGVPIETFHVKNGGWGWKNSYVYLDEDESSPAFFANKTMYNYLITDQTDDQVLGVYLQHPKMTFAKRGRLVLRVDIDQQLKDCLLLAGLTLAEKARRKAAAAGSQAGVMAGAGAY